MACFPRFTQTSCDTLPCPLPPDQVTIGLHMRVLDLVLRSVRGALAAQGATAVVVTSHHRDQR